MRKDCVSLKSGERSRETHFLVILLPVFVVVNQILVYFGIHKVTLVILQRVP